MLLLQLSLTKVLIIAVLVIPDLPASGQDSVQFKQKSLEKNDALKFADGVLYTFSRPLHWTGKDWMILGSTLGATAVLSLLDEPVNNAFENFDNPVMDGVERVGYHFGKPYSAFAVTGLFYLTGVILNDRWAKDTGIALGVTLFTSGLLQTILKDVVGRARPDTDYGPYKFNPLSRNAGFHSFPSGHYAVAFAVSFVLAQRVDSVPLKVLFFSVGATSAVARLYSESHWLSDIAFGGALAWFCANTAIKRLNLIRTKEKKGMKTSFQVTPMLQGLSFSYRF